MKKILIVRMWAEPLNIKNYNCQEIGLAKALIKKGNKCDIVLFSPKESYEEDYIIDDENKIHIYYLKARKILKNCFYEKKLYEIINQYDIVQSAEYDQLANMKLFKLIGDKLVIYHGPYRCNYNKGYPKKCLISDLIYKFNKKYKKVKCIAKSDLAKDYLIEKGFKNVVTCGVGLDTSRFEQSNEEDENPEIQKLINEKKETKYLLYIGKIEDRRNITFLIDLMEKFKIEKKNVKLVLVGNGEKRYKDKCLNLIKEKKLENYIKRFDGFKQVELKKLYNLCDLFLLPTKYEIFGMVLLEAIYFGIPIATTLNGGSSFLIKNNKNGFILPDNVELWFKKINENLYEKKVRVNKFIYSWDDIVDNFLNAYFKENE